MRYKTTSVRATSTSVSGRKTASSRIEYELMSHLRQRASQRKPSLNFARIVSASVLLSVAIGFYLLSDFISAIAPERGHLILSAVAICAVPVLLSDFFAMARDPLNRWQRKHTNRLLSRNGFTLVEILIVISIIAALSAMTFSMWRIASQGADRQSTQKVVSSVAALIDGAQGSGLSYSYPVNSSGTRITNASAAHSWVVVSLPLWDANRDGYLDGDPRKDPPDPDSASTDKEFTADEIADFDASDDIGTDYHGFIGENAGAALPPGHVDEYNRVIDAWGNVLRIEYAEQAGSQSRFAGRAFGVWSLGLNGIDENGLFEEDGSKDDVASW